MIQHSAESTQFIPMTQAKPLCAIKLDSTCHTSVSSGIPDAGLSSKVENAIVLLVIIYAISPNNPTVQCNVYSFQEAFATEQYN
jgi:hypothetical protein